MQLGDVIDSLGVEAAIADADLIVGAVVLLKVVDEDGMVHLSAAWSDGMSWIERVGMLDVAHVTERDSGSNAVTDD